MTLFYGLTQVANAPGSNMNAIASSPPRRTAIPVLDDRTWGYLSVALIGAILLPLVPIWTAAYSLALVAWLLQAMPCGRLRVTFGALAGLLAAVYLIGWIGRFLASPVSHIIDGFIFVYGLPVGLIPSAAQFTLQLLLVATMAWQLWTRVNGVSRGFVFACAGFAGWVALSTIAGLLVGQVDAADASLIAGSVWINWAGLALLGLCVIGTDADLVGLIKAFIIGGALLALGMVAQMVIEDFSYVLVSANPADFFERVRGSYYYHAPPAQMLAVISPLGLVLLGQRRWVALIGILVTVALAIVVLLNSTRGISLALLSGMSLLAIALLVSRHYKLLAVIPIVLVVAVMSQIYYVKPGTPTTDAIPAVTLNPSFRPTIPDPAEPENQTQIAGSGESVVDAAATPPSGPVPGPVPAVEQPAGNPPIAELPAPVSAAPAMQDVSVAEFTASNGMRLGLAETGLRSMQLHPLFGSGAGNAQLIMPGQSEFETSSHVLAVDIGVMTGLPGLALFLAMFAIPVAALALSIVMRREGSGFLPRAALLASIATYVTSSLFHPQERSEIIALALLLAGLGVAVVQVLRVAEPVAARRSRGPVLAVGSTVVGLGFAVWLVITSPSYVFPAIEFLGRYRSKLMADHTQVITNSPLLADVLRNGMRFVGVDSDVHTMADDPAELTAQDAFILWSPSREKVYPNLRQAAGLAAHARYGQWMGINVLSNWWLLDSFQPNIQFIKAGVYAGVPVALRLATSIPVRAGQTLMVDLADTALADETSADVVINGPPDGRAELRQGVGNTALSYNLPVTVARDGTKLEVTGATSDGVLEAVAYPGLMPSIAQFLTLRGWVDTFEAGEADVARLVDNDDHGGFWWKAGVTTVIEFEGEWTGLAAYRFKPMYDGLVRYELPPSWTIEARDFAGNWSVVEQRMLQAQPVGEPAFAIESTKPFTALRVTFSGSPAGASERYGLREVELFPVLPGTAQ